MNLSIAEGLYLIALDDEEGRLLAAAEKTIVDGLISASLLELIITGRVNANDGILTIADDSGTGNILLDNVLKAFQEGKDMVETLDDLRPHFKGIQDHVTEMLITRGIIKKESTKLLWIPVSERMDNANYAFEKHIRETIRGIVIDGKEPSPSFVLLTALIYYCNLLSEVFHDKDELIDAIKVAKDIIRSKKMDEDVSICLEMLKSHFGK